MKKINFALISDSLFVTICAFLFGFTFVRFFTKSAALALALAIMIAVLLGGGTFFLLFKKRAKKILIYSHTREKKTLALHLSVSSEKYVFDLFLKALDGTYAVGNRIEDENCAYFFNFTLSPLSPDDVALAIKCGGEKSKVIFCCGAGAESEELAKEFGVEIRQIGEVYALLEGKNLLPEKYACGVLSKTNIWQKIASRFNRRLCPSLFLCGISLLFFSFFTHYRIYYIVCGGLLLSLSAVSLLFGKAKR